MRTAIKTSPYDIGIICGFRGEVEQNKEFDEGDSNARWGQSDHSWRKGNNPCSLAIDFGPYSAKLRNYMWDDREAFKAISDHVIKVAKKLGYTVESGASYSTIKGGDMPHHVLKLRGHPPYNV